MRVVGRGRQCGIMEGPLFGYIDVIPLLIIHMYYRDVATTTAKVRLPQSATAVLHGSSHVTSKES